MFEDPLAKGANGYSGADIRRGCMMENVGLLCYVNISIGCENAHAYGEGLVHKSYIQRLGGGAENPVTTAAVIRRARDLRTEEASQQLQRLEKESARNTRKAKKREEVSNVRRLGLWNNNRDKTKTSLSPHRR